MSRFPFARALRSMRLGLVGVAALPLCLGPDASADENSIGLDFFKQSSCSAIQIYHAMERVAPAEMAQVKAGPVGSRRQKWLLNWLIRTREATDANLPIPGYEDGVGGQFGDLDWRTFFRTHSQEIAEACPNE